MTPWFRWFAWRPVWTTDRGWRWLRFVWRRHVPPILGIPGACWTFDNRVEVTMTPTRPNTGPRHTAGAELVNRRTA